MEKKSGFTTVYDAPEAGTVTFDDRADFKDDIESYLQILRQLKSEYGKDPEVMEGLEEIETNLNSLRASKDPPEEVRSRLDKLTQIPFGPGKNLDLAAFRKRAAQSKFSNPEEYMAHVQKLIRNTTGNLTQLVLFHPDDTILNRFLEELKKLEKATDYRTVRHAMNTFGKSPQLWHYNEKKKEFLQEWLRPFQEELGTPIESMTGEELWEALKRVDTLRETKLEEMTNLVQVNERRPFRKFNREMQPVMNGKNKDFWGGGEVRDEFIDLMKRIVKRFSFNLEDGFLLFKTKDEGFCYLIGFPDDAFESAVSTEKGKLALYPHLKVFLKGSGDKYSEITQEVYGKDTPAYFRALKTAVVPFLTSIAVMVEYELSPQIKQSFDMWI